VTLLVLVILAVIWAAVLLPPYLQNRSESRPADSISTFRNQLSVLERRSALLGPAVPGDVRTMRPAPVPSSQLQRARLARAEAKKRRRDILVTLLAAAGLTLVLGLVLPQVLLLHLLIDALLGAYVALLVRQRRMAEERAMKVRYLSSARRPAVPAPAQLALRRSAGG
jgi:Flp pilus assembly protein TadB